jgi:predicted anti-sigma-YlaC factor YlaD
MRNCISGGMTGCVEECRPILSLISEYLDRELPGEISLVVDAHLARCGSCREFTESLRRSVALARAFGVSAKPAPLSSEDRAELERAWRRCGR